MPSRISSKMLKEHEHICRFAKLEVLPLPMYVHLHICVLACSRAHMRTHTHTHVYTYTHVCTHTYMHARECDITIDLTNWGSHQPLACWRL